MILRMQKIRTKNHVQMMLTDAGRFTESTTQITLNFYSIFNSTTTHQVIPTSKRVSVMVVDMLGDVKSMGIV